MYVSQSEYMNVYVLEVAVIHIYLCHDINIYKWSNNCCMNDQTIVTSHECAWHTWLSHGARMNDQINFWIIHVWMIKLFKWSFWSNDFFDHIWSFIRAPWLIHMSYTHSRESCQTYEWVMSHVWTSHVTHINRAPHRIPGLKFIVFIFFTHMNESCQTCGRVMSHM